MEPKEVNGGTDAKCPAVKLNGGCQSQNSQECDSGMI